MRWLVVAGSGDQEALAEVGVADERRQVRVVRGGGDHQQRSRAAVLDATA
jgi:hypothetical protein